jgi:hypothetical protein
MKYLLLFVMICGVAYSQDSFYVKPAKLNMMQQHIYLLEQENKALKNQLEECKNSKEDKHLIINGVTSILSIVATGYCLREN